MKSTQENIQQASRKAWLVGLGICESSFQLASEKVDDWYVQSNEWINELMERGSQLEGEIQQKFSMPTAITDVVKRVEGGVSEERDNRLQALSDKLDTLTLLVAELSQPESKQQAKASVSAKAPAARKTTAANKNKTPAVKKTSVTTAPSAAKAPQKKAEAKSKSTLIAANSTAAKTANNKSQ